MIEVQVKTEGLSDLLKAAVGLPGIFQKCRSAAIRSIAWHIQQDLKATGRALVPKLNPHTGILAVTHTRGKREGHNVRWAKRRVNKKWTRGTSITHGLFDSANTDKKQGWVAKKLSNRQDPFSNFVNMVRYKVDDAELTAKIGVLNERANYALWMAKQSIGFSTTVTSDMRRMMFAAGFPLKKSTRQLKTPSRVWIKKVEDRWQPKATSFFEQRFWNAYEKYATGYTSLKGTYSSGWAGIS